MDQRNFCLLSILTQKLISSFQFYCIFMRQYFQSVRLYIVALIKFDQMVPKKSPSIVFQRTFSIFLPVKRNDDKIFTQPLQNVLFMNNNTTVLGINHFTWSCLTWQNIVVHAEQWEAIVQNNATLQLTSHRHNSPTQGIPLKQWAGQPFLPQYIIGSLVTTFQRTKN